ncbi:hypothetical protein KIPB_009465 [Kipferlia bialata]|uniref:Uncharacterized protein n=1 Tax=Kipferlia bialata TaxID=797122 RepID=A0A9K3D410_9EUKA|nr:hypothetical protein KIPB_009465 [Kipferlia bialata]|eukprot:g9465.t1
MTSVCKASRRCSHLGREIADLIAESRQSVRLGLKADMLRQWPIWSEEDERRLVGLLSSVALLGDTTGSRELDVVRFARSKVTMSRLFSSSAIMSEDTLQFA